MSDDQNQNQNTSASSGGTQAESFEAIKKAGEELRSKAADNAREVRAAAERDAARFAEIAREWWQRNAQSASDASRAFRGETEAWTRRTEDYVRDEPMKAVAIAAAMGALVAAFWMGSRRD